MENVYRHIITQFLDVYESTCHCYRDLNSKKMLKFATFLQRVTFFNSYTEEFRCKFIFLIFNIIFKQILKHLQDNIQICLGFDTNMSSQKWCGIPTLRGKMLKYRTKIHLRVKQNTQFLTMEE